jgi:hypothetical protein
MGLVSLSASTLWNRFLLFFMQPSKYPLEPWTIYMKPKRVHLFTIIQLSIFVLLYCVISVQTVSIIFPIIIALCIPFRTYFLPKLFTDEELVMIDGDEAQVQKWLRKHGGIVGSIVIDDKKNRDKADVTRYSTQEISDKSVAVASCVSSSDEHENEP